MAGRGRKIGVMSSYRRYHLINRYIGVSKSVEIVERAKLCFLLPKIKDSLINFFNNLIIKGRPRQVVKIDREIPGGRRAIGLKFVFPNDLTSKWPRATGEERLNP